MKNWGSRQTEFENFLEAEPNNTDPAKDWLIPEKAQMLAQRW